MMLIISEKTNLLAKDFISNPEILITFIYVVYDYIGLGNFYEDLPALYVSKHFQI
jgi:hypothetical protein